LEAFPLTSVLSVLRHSHIVAEAMIIANVLKQHEEFCGTDSTLA